MTPYAGTKVEFKGKIYMIMKTPEGKDGCSRCAFLHECHGNPEIFESFGNCEQGQDRYFVWFSYAKDSEREFKPVHLD